MFNLLDEFGSKQIIPIEIMNSIFALIFLSLLLIATTDDSVLSNEFTTSYFTDNDCSSWTSIGSNIPPDHFFTQCGSQRIFGGYKKFGGDQTLPIKVTRQYTALIAHYAVKIQAKIYKIDSWNNESLFVMVDNVAQKIYSFDQNSSSSNICGDPYPSIDSINTNFNDSIITMDFTVNHTRSVLDLAFETNLNSDRGWWGLRQIRVTMMLCDKSCKSCTNSSACISCETLITGLTLIGAYCQCPFGQIKQLITECTTMPCIMCVPGCSAGYYNSAVTGKCEYCHPACLTCSMPSNTFSPACGSCSLGYYRTNSLAQPCYNCLGGCSACNALSTTACTACKQGYFFSSGQCLTSCPNGKYSQENLKQCFTCSPSCLTCDGGTSFHCKSCTGILYLTPANKCEPSCPLPYFKYNNTCYEECPLGTFQDYVLYVCTSCPTNCNECPSAIACSKCVSGYYLLNGVCQASCPTTHYPSLTLGECLLCHTECLQCFGGSSTSCKICSDAGKILLNGGCYSSCPNGTYSALCLLCHSTCLQCTGPLQTDCLNCPSPNFLDLTSHKCLQTCISGTIVDKVNFTCRWCPNSMVGYFHQCVPCSSTCDTCYGTSFLECSSCSSGWQFYVTTCIKKVDSTQYIIKSDAKSVKTKTISIMLLVVLGISCVVLEMFFTYKTALLPTVEFIQILSYFLYLSIPMSETVQSILQLFSYTIFTSHISVSFGMKAQNMPLKISLMGKTGFYAIDTFGIHIVMIVTVLIMILVRKIRTLSKFVNFVHEKINPYLASYLYRMVILDQFFSLIIYMRYGGIDTTVGIASMVMVFVDLILLGLTLFWKIRPVNQQKKEYALFYFNQIQQKYQIEHSYHTNQNNPNHTTQNNNKSTLLAFLFYVGKVPFPLAIVYFINNGLYQAIAICGYSAFFLVMLIILPYKRKIYRFLYSFGAAIVLLSSILFIAVDKNQDYAVGLQIVWLIYISLSLLITFAQLLINYQLFIYFLKYLKYRLENSFNEEQNEPQSSQVSEIDQSQGKSQNDEDVKSRKQNIDLKCENLSAPTKNKKDQTSKDHLKEEQKKTNGNVPEQLTGQKFFTDNLNLKTEQNQKSRNMKGIRIQNDSSFLSKNQLTPANEDVKQNDSDDVDLDFDL